MSCLQPHCLSACSDVKAADYCVDLERVHFLQSNKRNGCGCLACGTEAMAPPPAQLAGQVCLHEVVTPGAVTFHCNVFHMRENIKPAQHCDTQWEHCKPTAEPSASSPAVHVVSLSHFLFPI